MRSICHFLPLLLLALPAAAAPSTTISPTAKHAYSANTGWCLFRAPVSAGIVSTETILASYAYSANIGWIDLGDGFPDNGYRYSNTGSDFGINVELNGELSGMAFAANVGWLKFDAFPTEHPSRARINLLNGEFDGYAYGANFGWLYLGGGRLKSDSMLCPDSDSDGLADSWEYQHFGSIAIATGTDDSDGDGSSNYTEQIARTNPNDFDENLVTSMTFDMTEHTVDISFTSVTGRIYRIEVSTDLENWSSPLGDFIATTPSTQRELALPTTETRVFYKVTAVKPLS